MVSERKRRRIEGKHHPLLKTVRRLARTGELSEDGQVLLETVRLVEEALASGAPVSHVLMSARHIARFRGLLEKLPVETTVYEVASNLFEMLVSTESSQGVLALALAPRWEEADLFSATCPLVLVLAGLQDPGNLGTIVRAAEAFGATGILLARGTVSPYNPKAIRASAGSFFRVPMLPDLTTERLAGLLRQREIPLLATVVEDGNPLTKKELTGPLAVAIGSEGAGLPKELLQAASDRLTIPMECSVRSLNAAIAASIILYEIARQRRGTDRA